MEEKNKKKKGNMELYGEFVPTFHAWVGLDEQKEIVERLENITKKKK